jgi:hypothetical protein
MFLIESEPGVDALILKIDLEDSQLKLHSRDTPKPLWLNLRPET